MGADGAEHGVVRLGQGAIALGARHMRRDRHHPADAGRLRRGEHIGQALGKLREVQVAVAVDQHDGFARRRRPLKPIGTPAVYPWRLADPQRRGPAVSTGSFARTTVFVRLRRRW